MKRKPDCKCPVCASQGVITFSFFDGEKSTFKSKRCGFCKGYGWISAVKMARKVFRARANA